MATNTELEEQNAELLARLDQLLEQNMELSNQVANLTKMLFGSRSEKTRYSQEEIPQNQTSLFDEPSDFFGQPEKEEGEISRITVISTHTRKHRVPGWKEKQLENLPTEEYHHRLEEPVCLCCNGEMKELGTKDWSEVKLIPAKLVRCRHIVHRYECRNCKKSGTNQIRVAPSPKRALPGSIASPSMITEAVYMKFTQFVPLERQLKDWQRLGLTLHSRTLSEWVNKVAEDWLAPIYQELKKQLLTKTILAVDETPSRILRRSDGKSGRSKSQNWVYRTIEGATHPITLFDSTLTRSRDELRKFLGNWQGLILCDGYSVYRQLPGIKFAHCWAHARRKWVEALELGGKASSPAVRLGKMVCDALFRMERDWQEMPIMARDQLRQKFARPLLEDFYLWLETQFAAPKSALDKAITYCLNQKAGLLKFLEVPALPIHNNGAENAIRPLTLGKKNWLFSTSEAGGKANAIYLSLVETCKANHIDFRQYLEKLLIELPEVDLIQEPEKINDYLPWSLAIIESCQPAKNMKKAA
ncbi:IS66 family transposase [Desemzia sp. FAM 23991]|uniref:IS66 family transposase n=1 Tax=unclassified Desemzia TaxID=2685243 RepID=UPI0038872C6B